ncbi:MAG: LLM class flavin-dependent oxidoreductase [Brachybacterium sp.]|nr:LLM class flavin-dependent oxidoreductase [Brachybacterium sp.]
MPETTTAPSGRGASERLSVGFLAHVEHSGITADQGGVRSRGLETGIDLFALAEDQGYDAGYVHTRHLQASLASPLPFLAAVGQRVPRIDLGVQVIPLRFENAGRLAEDLATTDLLIGGRLRAGVSSGYSAHDAVNIRAFGEVPGNTREHIDRVLSDLLSFLDGEIVSLADEHTETLKAGTAMRVQPQVETLHSRMAYGAATTSSAELAGSHGLGLQVGTLQPDDGSGRSFEELQREVIDTYREASRKAGHGDGHVSVGRQMIPVTEENELEYYSDIIERDRARGGRTTEEHRGIEVGGRDAVFGRVIVDDPEVILEHLAEDVALADADELVLTLPIDEDPGKIGRIVRLFAEHVIPEVPRR